MGVLKMACRRKLQLERIKMEASDPASDRSDYEEYPRCPGIVEKKKRNGMVALGAEEVSVLL